MTKLMWVDLETEGLDPQNDHILEIAGFFTTLDKPFEVQPWAVDHVLRIHLQSPSRMVPFVVDMHTRNGLLDECVQSSFIPDDVDRLLFDIVSREKEKVILAGSSVHFDLAFIRRWMPKTAGFLSHRVYDVSAIKLFCQSLGMPPFKKAEAHRAKADVLESVGHAVACREWLRGPFVDDWEEVDGS